MNQSQSTINLAKVAAALVVITAAVWILLLGAETNHVFKAALHTLIVVLTASTMFSIGCLWEKWDFVDRKET